MLIPGRPSADSQTVSRSSGNRQSQRTRTGQRRRRSRLRPGRPKQKARSPGDAPPVSSSSSERHVVASGVRTYVGRRRVTVGEQHIHHDVRRPAFGPRRPAVHARPERVRLGRRARKLTKSKASHADCTEYMNLAFSRVRGLRLPSTPACAAVREGEKSPPGRLGRNLILIDGLG